MLQPTDPAENWFWRQGTGEEHSLSGFFGSNRDRANVGLGFPRRVDRPQLGDGHPVAGRLPGGAARRGHRPGHRLRDAVLRAHRLRRASPVRRGVRRAAGHRLLRPGRSGSGGTRLGHRRRAPGHGLGLERRRSRLARGRGRPRRTEGPRARAAARGDGPGGGGCASRPAWSSAAKPSTWTVTTSGTTGWACRPADPAPGAARAARP
ncbi:hypothetical protein LT493_42605 [Streptomyces tricolor]|nr:hypothetical protein [Streptomyces tricolor]